jgi:TetR/AcrR family transcriptional regulator, cholesterol catabolism regulator
VVTELPKRRNREAEVRAAAIQVFFEKGYSAASIQDVANAVGVLKGSLYHYIDSKEDLLTAIFDDADEQATAIMEEVAAMEAPPLEKLRLYFERHVKWYLDNVEHATVYFREWRFLTGERLDVVIARRHRYEKWIKRLVDDCQKAGDIHSSVNTKYALFFILGAVNAVPDWYRPSGRDRPQKIASIYADLTIGTLTGTKSGLHTAPKRKAS